MIAIFYLVLQILKLYSYVVIANVIVSWLIEFNKEILDENLIESIEGLDNFYAISYSELSTHWNYKVYLSNNSKIKIQTLIAKSKGSKNFLSPDLQIKNILLTLKLPHHLSTIEKKL